MGYNLWGRKELDATECYVRESWFTMSCWFQGYNKVNVLYICHSFWRKQWHPTPVLLPGKSRGWRSLVGCSLWGCWESYTTERLHFHFPLSCIGEGNGNPLQCSCLENPRDGGAWQAAVHGVAQSQIRLKRLSSSSMPLFLSFFPHIGHYSVLSRVPCAIQ